MCSLLLTSSLTSMELNKLLLLDTTQNKILSPLIGSLATSLSLLIGSLVTCFRRLRSQVLLPPRHPRHCPSQYSHDKCPTFYMMSWHNIYLLQWWRGNSPNQFRNHLLLSFHISTHTVFVFATVFIVLMAWHFKVYLMQSAAQHPSAFPIPAKHTINPSISYSGNFLTVVLIHVSVIAIMSPNLYLIPSIPICLSNIHSESPSVSS